MPISVAIAEDNRFALRSCLDKLAGIPHLKVALTAANGQELLDALEKKPADIVLMDIEMPVLNGIETTAALRQHYPHIKVLMLTTFDDDEKIFQAILAGASGYLLKEEPAEVLIAALHDTLNGGAAMSATIAMKVLKMMRQSPAPTAPVAEAEDYGLTEREIELLEQLKAGYTYERIATHLHIAIGTVRKHIEHIYRKLRVKNKVEAVQKAFGK